MLRRPALTGGPLSQLKRAFGGEGRRGKGAGGTKPDWPNWFSLDTKPGKFKTRSSAVISKVGLSRAKKKEDFGVVLGCKIYVKEVVGKSLADKDGSLRPGDLVLKINGTPIEGLTLKDARKAGRRFFVSQFKPNPRAVKF